MKMAIFVAPILIVLGYISSDYYLESKAESDEKIYQLVVQDKCNILAHKCVLQAGEFKINLFDKFGKTTANSTFPLDSVIIFLVDSQNNSTAYPMKMAQTKYYWHSDTPLRENYLESGNPQKLRLIAKIKGGQYIAELSTP